MTGLKTHLLMDQPVPRRYCIVAASGQTTFIFNDLLYYYIFLFCSCTEIFQPVGKLTPINRRLDI